ncbi:fasciclin [Pseudomonas aeruginosa]|uniref:fasciclin domain-containing protein n=1 Tax=Pseudomonas aeruginosa TaxID=287 RepID=UPI000A122D83|nr:fasciclin domain-containing protein [Pseudomonas aeruginosa]ORL52267.1 fasciclin [Pseudomonas aeruginosa]
MKRNSIKAPLIASLLSLTLSTAVGLASTQAAEMTHDTVMVGGQGMLPTKDIIDNAVNSADHTTLVAAVKAAGLVQTLKGKGPFTVFAPVNSAFAALPAGTVDTLLKPENKAALTHVLTYHVVAGKLDMMELSRRIQAGGGKAELTTVSGGKLWLMMNGPHNIQIKDEKGGVADITTYDVNQSNGVIQVIDRVLLPKG